MWRFLWVKKKKKAGFLDICGCLLYDHHQLRVGVHASFCLALHPRRNPQQKSNYDKKRENMDWSCRTSCRVTDQLHRINLRKAKATGHSGLLFVYHMFTPGMKLHGQKYLDTWASRLQGDNSTGIYLLLWQHLSFHKILLTSLELRGSLSLLLRSLSLLLFFFSLLLLLYWK